MSAALGAELQNSTTGRFSGELSETQERPKAPPRGQVQLPGMSAWLPKQVTCEVDEPPRPPPLALDGVSAKNRAAIERMAHHGERIELDQASPAMLQGAEVRVSPGGTWIRGGTRENSQRIALAVNAAVFDDDELRVVATQCVCPIGHNVQKLLADAIAVKLGIPGARVIEVRARKP